MLNLILGRIKSGKSSYIIKTLNSRREEGSLLVVPESISHWTERRLCEICGNGVSSFAEVTSFRRLAVKIMSEIGGLSAQTVDEGKRILLLHSALRQVAPSLHKLSKVAANPSRLSDVLMSIDEFKAYGISPEKLASVSDDLSGKLAGKIFDLATIYAAYESTLGEDECDGRDELKFVADMLAEHKFFEGKTVFFDGFSGFTVSEFDIIESALCEAKEVYITLELDANAAEGDENGIFDKALSTRARLIEICKRNAVDVKETALSRECTSPLARLDTVLFGDAEEETKLQNSEITIARADGVYHECELAAAYILDGIREKGLRYRDFSVAVADEDKYLSVCEMVFSRYGIPVYTNRSEGITSKPLISLISSAFDCILKNFRTESVMEYIKTGFSGIASKTLDAFENYLYVWAPRGYEWKKGEDFTKNPLGFGEKETDESAELLRLVNAARRKVYEPIKRLSDAINREKTGEKCAEAIYQFINDINLPRRNNAFVYLSKMMGDFKTAQESERIMSILCEVIDCIGTVYGDEELTASELSALFELAASKYELGTIPTTLDCVTVGGISRADGERCKVRLILGANDGDFPQSSDSAGILTDKDREELSDFGIELAPGLSDRIFEEYRVIHDVICSADIALYISSDVVGEHGEENAESVVLGKIRKAFSGIENGMSVLDARLRAKTPCFDESIVRGDLNSLWENDEEYRNKLRASLNAKENTRGPIRKRENIKAIFGDRIFLSSTSAEQFCSCRYAYFLKYGLRAKSRKPAEILPVHVGNIIHFVLEKVIKELAEAGEYNLEIALSLSERAIDEYIETFLGGADKLSGRMAFLVKKIKKAAKSAVLDVCRELEKSKFKPSAFELKFSAFSDGELPAIEVKGEESTVLLGGAIDRVDIYEDGENLYFRVIDYKTGKKEFSLDKTLNGIGMQMLLYMFALEEMGFGRYGKGMNPAGVMYISFAKNVSATRGKSAPPKRRAGVVLRNLDIIDAMESGEEKEYLPLSFNKGGVLSQKSSVLSKEEFARVRARLYEILAKIGDEITKGEISANPYMHKDDTACDWCEYRSVCAFDDVRGNDTLRELCEVTKEDILSESEVEDGGNDDLD